MNIIQNVSKSIYSISRHYGGATINGKEYIYIPIEDILVKQSYFKEWRKSKKSFKHIKDGMDKMKVETVEKSEQGILF
jgi:hypothetical protein